jgi:uncharacterized membrane protein
MNKMLVAVFSTERAAYEGLGALKDLHYKGDITLYATAVIAKDASGALSMKESSDEGPVGTALGLLTGSVVGLLGGPVGVVVGASLGTVTGLIYDMVQSGINLDFLDDVSQALIPGKTAVLAEVDETWETPVDTKLGSLGALIFRRGRSGVVEDQMVRDAAALNAELDQLEDELEHAAAENRAAVQQKIDALRKKQAAQRAEIEARMEQSKREADAKIAALREQQKQASDQRKAQIEKRIAEVQADHDARRAKLQQARQLIKEALTP